MSLLTKGLRIFQNVCVHQHGCLRAHLSLQSTLVLLLRSRLSAQAQSLNQGHVNLNQSYFL